MAERVLRMDPLEVKGRVPSAPVQRYVFEPVEVIVEMPAQEATQRVVDAYVAEAVRDAVEATDVSPSPSAPASPATWAGAPARLHAAERMAIVPKFKQSGGELEGITRQAEELAYDYRMLIGHYETLIGESETGDPGAGLVLSAEETARAQVLVGELELERVLEQKSVVQATAGEREAYQEDKLRGLANWLTELEWALGRTDAALIVARRVLQSDKAPLESVQIERDGLARRTTDLRASVLALLTATGQMPEMGEVMLNGISLAALEPLLLFFTTDPVHAEILENVRQQLRPFPYRSPRQSEAAALEAFFGAVVLGALTDWLSALRAAGGARGLAVARTAEESGELLRLRILFDDPAQLEAALNEIDQLSDAMLTYARGTSSQAAEATTLADDAIRARMLTTRVRRELTDYRAAQTQLATAQNRPYVHQVYGDPTSPKVFLTGQRHLELLHYSNRGLIPNPESVGKTGLPARGKNRDLLAHALGHAGPEGSAFRGAVRPGTFTGYIHESEFALRIENVIGYDVNEVVEQLRYKPQWTHFSAEVEIAIDAAVPGNRITAIRYIKDGRFVGDWIPLAH
jgi:hypothetical protein